MTKIRSICLAALAALMLPVAAQADFIESGDTGSLVGSAHIVDAGTTHIRGGTGGADREDLFAFGWAGGLFQAATNGAFASSRTFDTMLFLFDAAGTFITANDDFGNLGSRISANLAAGTYYLGISGWSNDARNAASGDFRFGATGVLSHWQGGGHTGRYRIGLNRATASVPETGTIALLGLGLIGMGLARRRKV